MTDTKPVSNWATDFDVFDPDNIVEFIGHDWEKMRNIWLRDLAPDFFLLGIHGIYTLVFLAIGMILLNILGPKASELL